MSFPDKEPSAACAHTPGMKAASAQETADGMRLQVFLSHAGVSSRRAGAGIIESGRVLVNGALVLEKSFRVFPGDEVLLDGKPIFLEEKKRYVLLNKPKGYISTLSDERSRPTAASLVADKYPERLYNVGRLDMYSEGALIFTNDGDFASKISHPSSGIEKEYIVETASPCGEEALRAFQNGICIDGVFFKAVQTVKLSPACAKIVLAEGKNREIRRVFAYFGLRVKTLKRVRIGCVRLGNLAAGESRDLAIEEIEGLRENFKKR